MKGRDFLAPIAGSGEAMNVFAVIVRNSIDERPDKVGIFDNTVRLDQEYMQVLGQVTHEMATKVGKEVLVFPFKLADVTKALNNVGRALGLVDTLSVYQCRHGGASHDLCNKLRCRGDVQARGRWVTEASLKRYTKTGKIQTLLAELTPEVLAYLRTSASRIDKVLMRAVRFRPPPGSALGR